MVDTKLELHYFPHDPLTGSLDYIQHDTGRGGSRAGLDEKCACRYQESKLLCLRATLARSRASMMSAKP